MQTNLDASDRKKILTVTYYCKRCGETSTHTAYDGDNMDDFIAEVKYVYRDNDLSLCQPCKIAFEVLKETIDNHRKEELQKFWDIFSG
jgi:hypothetical protein